LERRNNPALEAQAAAHWNRMLEFAMKQQAEGNGRPQCPACARGNHDGPKCRLCGADVTLKPNNVVAESDKFDSSISLYTSRTDDMSPLAVGGRITSLGDPDHDRETNKRAVAMLLSSSRRKGTQSQKIKKPRPNDGVSTGGRGRGRGRGGRGNPTDEEDLLKVHSHAAMVRYLSSLSCLCCHYSTLFSHVSYSLRTDPK
jgi:hypothetical protein